MMIERHLSSSPRCLLIRSVRDPGKYRPSTPSFLPRDRVLSPRRGISSSARVKYLSLNVHGRRFSQDSMHHAKTKDSVRFEDLPQGALSLEPVPLEHASVQYPTVITQAQANMRKFDNCVLLTRVGGFYELYLDQAEGYGPLLNLKVAQKNTKRGPVPMSGFPFFQLDRFLKILVQDLNKYVAIAEEFPAPEEGSEGSLMWDRRVSRVVTPGTLIDEQFMDPYANNYILSIHVEKQPGLDKASDEDTSEDVVLDANIAELASSIPIGLAWLDLSTGQFFTQSSTLQLLSSIISRVSPSEIVLDEDLQVMQGHGIFEVLQEEKHLITYSPVATVMPIRDWAYLLDSEVSPALIDNFTHEEVVAGSVLLKYVEARLTDLSMKLQPPTRYQTMEIMTIDRNSMRALEIKETIRDRAFRGSLLHAMRRTVTKSGARLLNGWLSSPATSLETINSRLDLVAYMIEDRSLHEQIVSRLRRSHDSQRLVQKFSLGRGDPEDLLALATTINSTQSLVAMITENIDRANISGRQQAECLASLISRIQLDGPIELASRIFDAVDQEGLVRQRRIDDSEAGEMVALARGIVSSQGSLEDAAILPKTKSKKKPTYSATHEHYLDNGDAWIMTPSASPVLRKLHDDLEQLVQDTTNLEQSLRERLGAPSLTLRFTPGLRYICHVKGKAPLHKEGLSSVSSSKSTQSFHHPEWTSLGKKTDEIKYLIRAEEQRVFRNLRQEVIRNLVKLRRNAMVLDELDVACSFATLAEEQNLVRPILNDSLTHKIIGGRHPTVQGGLREQGRSFTTNDCFVGDASRLWLITGPNMAGKSTFLRQNALITIMAQVGCYVPAEYAEIGIVDQIFSRVGSADNLYRDQSTFMVEMLETAAILRNATPRSFVIMDEIGRGTTPEDGIGIAYACLWHLHSVNQCRVLFATHFHVLADLAKEMEGMGCYSTDVMEDGDGGFSFLHRLKKGVNRKSHALKVARLAGLPEGAIDVARKMIESRRGAIS